MTMNESIREDHKKLIYGQASKKYRKELVKKSDRPSDTVQTLKFRLEIKDLGEEIKFDELKKLYDIVEGVQKGSLSYLLFTLILSGFRIFPKAQVTQNFANRNSIRDDDFKCVVVDQFGKKPIGEILPNFVPSRLFDRFATIPRGTGGKNVDFEARIISSEYKKFFKSKDTQTPASGLIDEIARAIKGQFSSWKDVRDNPKKAASAVDEVLKKYGNFPSLFEMASKPMAELPKNSTICFDDEAPVACPDDELNPYMAVASLLQRFKGKVDSKDAKSKELREFVQSNLTAGGNYEGLSWFFNEGFEIFKNTQIFSSDKEEGLQKLFNVSSDKVPYLQKLKEAVEAVPEITSLFTKKSPLGYHKFRSTFGGHIDSWIANYVKRLCELDALVKSLPSEIKIPEYFVKNEKDFISHSGLIREEVEETVCSFAECVKAGSSALSKLLGRTKELPGKNDVEAVTSLVLSINRVTRIRQSLVNAMNQAKDDEDSEWKEIKEQVDKDSNWKIWTELQSLPKLNDLSGGVPKAQDEVEKALKEFETLEKCQKDDFNKVIQWAESNECIDALFDVVETSEREKINKRPNCGLNQKEQAIRYLFGQVAKIVQKNQDESSKKIKEWFKEKQFFLNPKDFNKYFYNHLGFLYKSPFSSSKHHGYCITPAFIENSRQLWNELCGFLEEISDQVRPYSEEKTTLQKIQRFVMTQKLSCIKDELPEEIAKLSIPKEFEESYSEEISFLQRRKTLPVKMYIKAFNLYDNLLNGLSFLLKRERFYLRTKFSWIGNSNLTYVPKEKLWKIPERYRKNSKWAKMLSSEKIVMNENGEVDVIKTFENVTSSEKDIQDFIRLLIQLPHDWCYLSPFKKSSGQGKRVLFVKKKGSKGMQITLGKEQTKNLIRLIGPSSFKGQLDQMLLNKLIAGDFMLLIDQLIRQKIIGNRLELNNEPPVATIAIPLTSKFEKKELKLDLCPFRRVLAVDQGEAGIAYAVFELNDVDKEKPMPIAKGTVRIPSIRRLIKGVNKYRKSEQKTQKFSQRFDSTMFNIRENVTGDVCHAIVGLMEKYDAFPVLEYQVKNLESGSKQLSLVYKAVNSHFLYSKVEGQDALRKQLWFGSYGWTIEGFETEVSKKGETEDGEETYKEDKPGKKDKAKTEFRPLKVFPGFSVDARFTSQTCSCCGNNIGELLAKLAEANKNNKNLKIKVGKEGKVQVEGKEIQLFGPDNSKPDKYYRRRKERAPLTVPWREGELNFQEFKQIVRNNLRRPPRSTMSRDTTQSRFYCVFTECEMHSKEQHADVNAAINIGRKFFAQVHRTKKK